MSKLKAWELLVKNEPSVKADRLTPFEKCQVVSSKSTAHLSVGDGYCYTLHSDGTYTKERIPSEIKFV